MYLVVVSHKVCWPIPNSQVGYATDGGFPLQMRYLSEIFSRTTLVVPCGQSGSVTGLTSLSGNHLAVEPLSIPLGTGIMRKLLFAVWLFKAAATIWKAIRRADAVHAPIPGDVGTIGILFALLQRKRIFIRHCGNWLQPRTVAERFWKFGMEALAGRKNAMLATGGGPAPPSARNSNIEWIFATSLTKKQLIPLKSQPRDRNRPRLIIACRQEERKGTDVVIKSLPRILRAFPNADLTIAGGGSQLDRFKALAGTYGVSENVRFLGQLSQKSVLRLLEESDIFCFPTSASEGFPKAVLEALAAGLPVVTTRVSVLPQLLSYGGGVLLDAPDPEKVADAVIDILSDPERYEEMSKRAIKTAREYTLENWQERIAEFLERSWRMDRPFRRYIQEHPASPL